MLSSLRRNEPRYEKLETFTPDLVDHFADGPPCLQHIMTMGFPEGGETYLCSMLEFITARRNPDDWQEDLMKFNYEHLPEPLPMGEVNGLSKVSQQKRICLTPASKVQYATIAKNLNA